MSEAVTKAEPAEVVRMDPTAQVLQMAQSPELDVDKLERLMDLATAWQEREARAAFDAAFAAFQNECPPIRHNDKANIRTKGGTSYGYTYATLDAIAVTVRPFLHKHGLSYTWDSRVEQGNVECVCTVRHVSGHERTATFSAPMDTSAAMSGPQKAAAALTYAKRQSLIQVLGITTADTDTDAALPDDNATITEAQAARVLEMIEKAGAEAGDRVLKWAKASKVADIPASKYGDVMYSLNKAAEAS